MKQIRTLLARAGKSQRALAEHLGVSPAAITQLLNHGQWPRSMDQAHLQDGIRGFLKEAGIGANDLTGLFKADGPVEGIQTAATSTTEDIMLLRKQGLHPEAKRHFGLTRDVFNDEIRSAEDVFLSPDVRLVREVLHQCARHGGFVAVVGESGAGKSTLRRDLNDRIQRESLPVVVIEPYVLAMEDNDKKGKTLKSAHIAEAIIHSVAPLERPKQSPEARFRQLHRILRDSSRAGNSHLLVIEEAHSLPVPTLKHLKRFFELEDGFKKLLGIVLIGQPELKMKLAENNHEVREVVQRCEIIELTPMDATLEDFLKFKFSRVGKNVGEIIDKSGMDALRDKLTLTTNRNRRENVSLLYPLAVGNLLTAAMNSAADIGIPQVTGDVVREV